MKVTLISWTKDPIETVIKIWDASKTNIPTNQLGEVDTKLDNLSLFQRIIDQQIPVSEHIVFNFIIDDAPISWREQAVRHRVGVKYGDNYAVDIIPEADFTFWSSSMRIMSMEDFAVNEQYFVPDSVAKNPLAYHEYVKAMDAIEKSYVYLTAVGVPMEDARNVIPLGATHRIAMTINLRSLQHIIGERGCWILQASLWHPIITGIIDELVTKIHPIFSNLAAPPCVKNNEFKGCVFNEENSRRLDGADALPVCPLWYTSKYSPRPLNESEIADVDEIIPLFEKMWGQPELGKTWEWQSQ